MSDSASTDSYETFKSEELAEGTARTISDDDYRTARELVTSSTTDANYFTAEGVDDSVESTLKDARTLTYLNEAHNRSMVSSSTLEDGSWQDLEHDALSAWVGPANGNESEEKRQEIVLHLTRHDCNARHELRRLGQQPGGFVSDALRRLVWPKLVRVDVIETSPRPDQATMEAHPFYQQVVLDVNRSLKRFPPSIVEVQRMAMQDALVRLIMRVLIKVSFRRCLDGDDDELIGLFIVCVSQNPQLHYYQGYHDICVTFLLILGEEMAFHVVNRLSRTHLAVYMEKTMENTSNLLELIPLVVEKESPSLGMFLRASDVGTIFSLSWVITWFSHVLRGYDTVGRLFDLFIVSHKYMPLYLTVALLLYKEEEIKRLDCDMASVHQYLTRMLESEEDSLPFERLIANALTLIKLYAPDELNKELTKLALAKRSLQASRMTTLRKLFTMRGLCDLARSKGYGLASMTILVVVAASFVQFYWNKSK